MKTVILRVLPERVPGFTQTEIREAVKSHLPEALFPGGVKEDWWVNTVHLDLEAKGIVVREKIRPLKWHRRQ